jgi:hypothetical protein
MAAPLRQAKLATTYTTYQQPPPHLAIEHCGIQGLLKPTCSEFFLSSASGIVPCSSLCKFDGMHQILFPFVSSYSVLNFRTHYGCVLCIHYHLIGCNRGYGLHGLNQWTPLDGTTPNSHSKCWAILDMDSSQDNLAPHSGNIVAQHAFAVRAGPRLSKSSAISLLRSDPESDAA